MRVTRHKQKTRVAIKNLSTVGNDINVDNACRLD
jgi:hypothetical protein